MQILLNLKKNIKVRGSAKSSPPGSRLTVVCRRHTTRKTAIQGGNEKWVNWEYKTKVFYQSMYDELIKLHEIAAAAELKKYITDVDYEHAFAQQKYLENKAIDYDIFEIVSKQEEVYEKYKKKIEKIKYE